MSPLLFKSSSSSSRPQQYQSLRYFVEARVKWVRDRALDHTVEREKNLRPMLALKNLIKSEPSKSIPISIAAENKVKLDLPSRAIDFIRKYPSIFQEFLPPGVPAARPHVKLTPEILAIDEEEQLIYQRDSYREDVANRLLKLIMLTRINKIPIPVLERLKWDLGLPQDYARTLVTDFPDYFQITSVKGSSNNGDESRYLALELVCWSDELAVSVMEKKAASKGEKKKGMPLAFPLQYSRGFDLEKKIKNWTDEWQKLPYISPYEDASHLQPKSDQAEKWTVAVLHELLHLFISKKSEKENILCLGEYLGFGSRFKRALINHPDIFYVSSKLRTHTVVLREAFKRDLMLEKHPLMGMRYQYIHLMNKVNNQVKPSSSTNTPPLQKQNPRDDEGGMDSEDENTTDDDYDNDSDVTDEDDELHGQQSSRRGRMPRNAYGNIETTKMSRNTVQSSSTKRTPNMVGDRVPTPTSRRTDSRRGHNSGTKSPGRADHSRSRGRLSTEKISTHQ
ncbi:hypothetical protein ACHQM5_017494 [Ranunculus cassubicifolius]